MKPSMTHMMKEIYAVIMLRKTQAITSYNPSEIFVQSAKALAPCTKFTWVVTCYLLLVVCNVSGPLEDKGHKRLNESSVT